MRKKRGQGEGSIFQEAPGRWRGLHLGWAEERQAHPEEDLHGHHAPRGFRKSSLKRSAITRSESTLRQSVRPLDNSFVPGSTKWQNKTSGHRRMLATRGSFIGTSSLGSVTVFRSSKLSPQQFQAFLNEKLTSVKCPHCESKYCPQTCGSI